MSTLRKSQVLSAFIKQYTEQNGKMPTRREIELELQRPFRFTTKPMLPKDGAKSNVSYLRQTMSGLLQDGRDIINLLKDMNTSLNQLETSFDKEKEEVNHKAQEALDYIRAVGENETAVSLMFSGIPVSAGASTGVVQADDGITLRPTFNTIDVTEITAAAITQTETVTRQKLSDPSKLLEGSPFTGSVRSLKSSWVGVDMDFQFPHTITESDKREDKDDDPEIIYPSVNAVRLAGSPCKVTISFLNPDTEQWEDEATLDFNGNLTFYTSKAVPSARIRFWNQGSDINLSVFSVEWLTGDFVDTGYYYTLPIFLTPNSEPNLTSYIIGSFLADVKGYIPPSGNIEVEYAILNQADLGTYYYGDISGSLLNTIETWNPLNGMTGEIRSGYNNNATTVTRQGTGDVQTIVTGQRPLDIVITAEDTGSDEWLNTEEHPNYKIWRSYLIVDQTDTLQVHPEMINMVVIKPVDGNANLYRPGNNGRVQLPAGVYKILFNIPLNAELMDFETYGQLDESPYDLAGAYSLGENMQLKKYGIPFKRVQNFAQAPNGDGYVLNAGSVMIETKPNTIYTIKYVRRSGSIADYSSVPTAVLFRIKLTASANDETPVVRRVRVLTTRDLVTMASTGEDAPLNIPNPDSEAIPPRQGLQPPPPGGAPPRGGGGF